MLILVSATATVSAENWPQWRGPGSQGISTEARVADRLELDEEHPRGRQSCRRALVADRVGGPDLRDRRGRRGSRAWREGGRAHASTDRCWIHPDSVAADKKHTLKVLALDAGTGKVALGAHGLRRHRLRRASSAEQLRRADGGDRRTRWSMRISGRRGSMPTTSPVGSPGRSSSISRRWVLAPARHRCSFRISSSSSATRTKARRP